MQLLNSLRLSIIFISISLYFSIERYFSNSSSYTLLKISSFAGLGLALILTLLLARQATVKKLKNESKIWRLMLYWLIGVVVAMGMYELYKIRIDVKGNVNDFVIKILYTGYMALGGISLIWGLGLELSRSRHGTGEFADKNQVSMFARPLASMGILAVFLMSVNYIGFKTNKIKDLSYLKTSEPSTATIALIKTLTQKLDIYLFYRDQNEIQSQISSYFNKLAQSENRIKIHYFDKDLSPSLARKLKVSRNGQVVLVIDNEGKLKKSRLQVGENFTEARRMLRTLDSEFQSRFKKITTARKTIYVTKGHKESSWYGDFKEDQLKSLTTLEGYLAKQNYLLKPLGISEGLLKDVPSDASAVFVIGAMTAFSELEAESIKRYVEGGGNLFVALDLEKYNQMTDQVYVPDSLDLEDWPLLKVLSTFGVSYKMSPIADETSFVSATKTEIDRWFGYSNRFTSHPSISSLARNDQRLAVLFYQTGSFEVDKKNKKWKSSETIGSLRTSFKDLNKDLKFDKGVEKKTSLSLALALEALDKKSKLGRMVFAADSQVLSDAILKNPGNILYFADSIKWMLKEDELMGENADEADIRIRHSQKGDLLIFNISIIAVPGLVLLIGFIVLRRRKTKFGSNGENA